MTLAEQAYCGEPGRLYWERNQGRLDGERGLRAQTIRNFVPGLAHSAWLEVGCGRGHNMMPWDVGLDCDARQLQHLSAGRIGVIGSVYDLPFPDGHFSVVFSVGCLMHLHSGMCKVALQELARVSSHYVVLGEYVNDQEEPLSGYHWDGMLWRRPYEVPGFCLVKQQAPLPPFDPDVTFMLFEKGALDAGGL